MRVDDILERLIRLDEDAELMFSPDIEFKCYIVGGGALMIMGYIIRATNDIDILETMPDLLQDLFKKYNMNNAVISYADNFPSGYEARAKKVDINTTKIEFYTLSLEDLVISKLCTTRYMQDTSDIESEKVISELNWIKLEELADGMKNTMISKMNYEGFRYNYQNYVRRFRNARIDN
ncbi:MAG: hypothetical protein HDQ96_15710 [Lachnospiraceae bacterium]|nr:hypothetical protein [Lachnospiraceae bacterium]